MNEKTKELARETPTAILKVKGDITYMEMDALKAALDKIKGVV